MKRGEVWWVNFDPSVGGEIRKKRPAVIVSNDASNKFLNRAKPNLIFTEGELTSKSSERWLMPASLTSHVIVLKQCEVVKNEQ